MINAPADRLRRWQEEVARNPGSDAFVPLADLYRAQGRLDVALRVCWRGLERNPEHVEGHYLLGRIYRDSEEAERAYDEWDIALGLEPSHVPSRRAIGFLCLERGDYQEAEKHLRMALETDPDDPRLRRAIARLERRSNGRGVGSSFWAQAAPILERGIEAFVRETHVRMVLAIDPTGRVVSHHGLAEGMDVPAFASLAAGIHAASGEIARMMGQGGFSQLYQGKGEHQIFLGEIRLPRTSVLMVAVFGAGTPVGLVRTVFVDVARELESANWPSLSDRPTAEGLEAELARGVERFGGGWMRPDREGRA